MKVFRSLSAAGSLPAPHVGIGNFDGVHLGHQRILEAAIRGARGAGGTAVAMTFDPHPLSILSPTGRPPLITPFEEKVRVLEARGLDVLLVVPFTRELAAISAEAFVSDVLSRQVGAKRVYVGANFHFGRGGQGDFELLRREGGRLGIDVEKVEVVLLDSRPVSSTRIRDNIARGAVDRAA
ncbi:MAG: FAD synthetase family protein, partial [Acidobacteria bacterium]|nr:FAD synthetase family protein [Acidobacteriota bacterium]